MNNKRETTERMTTARKPHCNAPVIDAGTRLKWGLALLGKDKAEQYLAWLHLRLSAMDR